MVCDRAQVEPEEHFGLRECSEVGRGWHESGTAQFHTHMAPPPSSVSVPSLSRLKHSGNRGDAPCELETTEGRGDRSLLGAGIVPLTCKHDIGCSA